MKRKGLWIALALVPMCVVSLGAIAASPQASAKGANVQCKMTFTLSGWSAIYQTADGHGKVTCSNGQSANVDLQAKGGGLTVGKYKLDDGHGSFTGVHDISDIYGAYAMANAHAGAVGSSHAAALTKGDVSLGLTGTGQGWDIGVGFSGFTIKKAQ